MKKKYFIKKLNINKLNIKKTKKIIFYIKFLIIE